MMSEEKKVYLKVPCELFKGFASTAEKRRECIQGIFKYGLYSLSQKYGSKKLACAYLNLVTEGYDIENFIKRGEEIAKAVKGKCYFYVSVKKLWEFHNDSKKFEESVLFLAYLALSSIQGNRSYFFSSNGLLLARMDGQDKVNYGEKLNVDKDTGNTEIRRSADNLILENSELKSYASKYKMNALRELLYTYYKVSSYSPRGARGFYFSTTLGLEDLIKTVSFAILLRAQQKKESSLKQETKKIVEKLKIESDKELLKIDPINDPINDPIKDPINDPTII